MTLAKLAAVTVDDDGKETFVTGGSLDRIQKVRKITTLLLATIVFFFSDGCKQTRRRVV